MCVCVCVKGTCVYICIPHQLALSKLPLHTHMNVMCPSCPGYARSLLCQRTGKRLKQWEKFLEEDGAAEDKELGTGQTATS